MSVNGWLGLAYELRQIEEEEQAVPLTRAAAIARREATAARRTTANGELHRTALEAQQAILRHAVRTADVLLARRVGRALRVGDFGGDAGHVEGLLGVVRDARSDELDVLDAVARLALLPPAVD
jgi:hypothetical protein